MTRYRVVYRWRCADTWDTFTLTAKTRVDAEQLAYAHLYDLYMPDVLICLNAARVSR